MQALSVASVAAKSDGSLASARPQVAIAQTPIKMNFVVVPKHTQLSEKLDV
jgi:hypothetical protein